LRKKKILHFFPYVIMLKLCHPMAAIFEFWSTHTQK